MTPGEAFDLVIGFLLLAAAALLYGLFAATVAAAAVAFAGSFVAAAALCGLFALTAGLWVAAGDSLDNDDETV